MNFRGQKQFRTLCGSLITCMVTIIFLTYSFNQGLVFINKKDITVSSYDIVDLEGTEEVVKIAEGKGGIVIDVKTPIIPDFETEESTEEIIDHRFGTLKAY